MSTMQGIIITGPGKFEYRQDLRVPVPKSGEVRIKVLAAGICGTDVHITRGDESLMSLITPPVVLGHEFCGEVDSWGDGVSGFKKGEYVSAEMHEVCWACRACADKKHHACEHTKIHGLQLDGAFTDYVVVSAKNVIKLPKSIPVKVGAILDALGNAVHTVCKTTIAEKSAVMVGYGPIGAMACEVAIFLGVSSLYVVDVNERALARAEVWVERKGLGKRVTIVDGRKQNTAENILDLSRGGCDVGLEFSGAQAGLNLALSVVRPGGDLSLLGIPKEADITIKNYGKNVIMKGLTLYGVIGREMFNTWTKMIGFLEQGLDVTTLISGEYPLRDFESGLRKFAAGEEQKVVLYPSR